MSSIKNKIRRASETKARVKQMMFNLTFEKSMWNRIRSQPKQNKETNAPPITSKRD